MNQKEREILKLEESFRDTIENDILKQNTENKKIKIKDIKLVGQATWKDKINGKDISENVFIVEKEIIETDENKKERITEQKSYYLGNKCIAGTLGNNEIIYNETFANSEQDKLKAINELLETTPEEQIENNSMNKLRTKEIAEILTAHLGRKISEEEAQQLLENMDKEEIEKLKEEKEENSKDKKEENKLSKKQTDNIKIKGMQEIDLNKKVDGKETLGKRLDLTGYDNIYVVYSENVDNITSGEKRNNTTYSLVGTKKDGTAKVLNDEFEMDKTVGNGATRTQTKIRANSTATRDSKDMSVYTRKSNGMSIGCENDMGNINMFLYQKTKEENENVGIQIETSQTPIIPIETREIMNRNKGVYQKDKVQNEIQEHTDHGCNPKDVKDFDGNENTETHTDKEYTEIDENDYIPNTNMTWRQFANKCGYRGEGDIEKAVQTVNSMEEVNQEKLEKYIEEKEEEFGEKEHKI